MHSCGLHSFSFIEDVHFLSQLAMSESGDLFDAIQVALVQVMEAFHRGDDLDGASTIFRCGLNLPSPQLMAFPASC